MISWFLVSMWLKRFVKNKAKKMPFRFEKALGKFFPAIFIGSLLF